MSDPGTPTLDQLRVFLTVVEVGSFAGAARRLGRATSVISYSIANLEAQLGALHGDTRTDEVGEMRKLGANQVCHIDPLPFVADEQVLIG